MNLNWTFSFFIINEIRYLKYNKRHANISGTIIEKNNNCKPIDDEDTQDVPYYLLNFYVQFLKFISLKLIFMQRDIFMSCNFALIIFHKNKFQIKSKIHLK